MKLPCIEGVNNKFQPQEVHPVVRLKTSLKSPEPGFDNHHLPPLHSLCSQLYLLLEERNVPDCVRQTDRQTSRQTDGRETPPHSFRQPGDVSASQPVCSVTLRGCSGASSCILLTVRQAFPVLRRPRASEDGSRRDTRCVQASDFFKHGRTDGAF